MRQWLHTTDGGSAFNDFYPAGASNDPNAPYNALPGCECDPELEDLNCPDCGACVECQGHESDCDFGFDPDTVRDNWLDSRDDWDY